MRNDRGFYKALVGSLETCEAEKYGSSLASAGGC